MYSACRDDISRRVPFLFSLGPVKTRLVAPLNGWEGACFDLQSNLAPQLIRSNPVMPFPPVLSGSFPQMHHGFTKSKRDNITGGASEGRCKYRNPVARDDARSGIESLKAMGNAK